MFKPVTFKYFLFSTLLAFVENFDGALGIIQGQEGKTQMKPNYDCGSDLLNKTMEQLEFLQHEIASKDSLIEELTFQILESLGNFISNEEQTKALQNKLDQEHKTIKILQTEMNLRHAEIASKANEIEQLNRRMDLLRTELASKDAAIGANKQLLLENDELKNRTEEHDILWKCFDLFL